MSRSGRCAVPAHLLGRRSPGSSRTVERLVDQFRDEGIVEWNFQNQQPVVAGTPQLINDDFQIRVPPQLPVPLRDPEPGKGEVAARQ